MIIESIIFIYLWLHIYNDAFKHPSLEGDATYLIIVSCQKLSTRYLKLKIINKGNLIFSLLEIINSSLHL